MNLVINFRILESDPGTSARSVEIKDLFQCLELSVVHIRSVQYHVAKSRNLERILVALAFGDFESAIVRLRGIDLRHTDNLEVAVGKGRDAVTFKATSASRSEEVESSSLRGRQSSELAPDKAVERRVVSCKRSLKRCNGLKNVIKRHSRAGGPAERCIETFSILRNTLELSYQRIGIFIHLDVAGDWTFRLLLKILRAAIPKLLVIISGIPQRRGSTAHNRAARSLSS